MASIDRYRPPREGYQPPSLQGSARHERPSRSPPRRREVPPAAPTPPQQSARTSPPRPQATSSQQTPLRSGEETPLALPNQWFFTTDEVHSTPSIIDGISPSEERLRRAKGINFIYQAGVMLDLPQITLWVAGVFFHRFFMRFSMVQEKGGIHHYVCFSSFSSCSALFEMHDRPFLSSSVFHLVGDDANLTSHRISPQLLCFLPIKPRKIAEKPRKSSSPLLG